MLQGRLNAAVAALLVLVQLLCDLLPGHERPIPQGFAFERCSIAKSTLANISVRQMALTTGWQRSSASNRQEHEIGLRFAATILFCPAPRGLDIS
jgi:hypothetical protein